MTWMALGKLQSKSFAKEKHAFFQLMPSLD